MQCYQTLVANEEIVVNYGDGYWANRFHLSWPPHSIEYSPLQRDLICAYHLIPLPDRTSISQKESKQRKSYSFPTLSPSPPLSLPLAKLDTIAGTYNSSKNFCVTISFSSNGGVSDHFHLLMLLCLLILTPPRCLYFNNFSENTIVLLDYKCGGQSHTHYTNPVLQSFSVTISFCTRCISVAPRFCPFYLLMNFQISFLHSL